MMKETVTKIIPNFSFVNYVDVAERKAWHDALISGKYKQGTGVMCDKDTNSYCCLGVYAAEIKDVGESYLWSCRLPSDLTSQFSCYYDDKYNANAWAIGTNPYIGVMGGRKVNAADLNDSCGLSLAQIAQLIYPEGYGTVEVSIKEDGIS